MRKLVLLAAASALAAPSTVQAMSAHTVDNVAAKSKSVAFGKTDGAKATLRAYRKVVNRHGRRAAGRNIVRKGVRYRWVSRSGKGRHWSVRRATWNEVKAFKSRLDALVAPAPRFMRTVAVPPPLPPAGTLTAGRVASLPTCTWKPESGGSYTAVNASSGAYGKYQIMPFHWSKGVCRGLGRDPAGQESCAARVYASSGVGAWVNC